MNPTLAALYGTGLEKTASEEDEIDLSQISAADFLAALDEIEEGEKVANDDGLDLSDLSDDELINLYESFESEDTIEKMASSGELEYWDMAGRIMAHAYADEAEKTASGEHFDMNDLSDDEIILLGYELEKEAGAMTVRDVPAIPGPRGGGRRAAMLAAALGLGAAGVAGARAMSRRRAASKTLSAKAIRAIRSQFPKATKGLSDSQIAMRAAGAGAAGVGAAGLGALAAS